MNFYSTIKTFFHNHEKNPNERRGDACCGSFGRCLGSGAEYRQKVKNAKGIEVIYQSVYKGRISPVQTVMNVSGDEVAIDSRFNRPEGEEAREERPGRKQPVTKTFINYSNDKIYRWAELPDGKTISSVNAFRIDSTMKEVGKEKYLGLDCTVMRTIINSNTIDIWFTTAIPFRGTPQPNVGVPDGLVLRVIRNGDSVQEAVEINPVKTQANLFPSTWGEEMDINEYQYAINQSGVITVPVFDQQRINFDGAKLPQELVGGEVYNAGGGTIILKKVKLPEDISDETFSWKWCSTPTATPTTAPVRCS